METDVRVTAWTEEKKIHRFVKITISESEIEKAAIEQYRESWPEDFETCEIEASVEETRIN
jgi:hypothetical protein